MLRFLLSILIFLTAAFQATAELEYDDYYDLNFVEEITLPDGRVLATGTGEYATTLELDGEVLIEHSHIALLDLRHMGVLVETSDGGNACPYTFMLFDKDEGEFHDVRPGRDRSQVFAECEYLISAVADANLVLTWRYDPRAYAQAYIWNGFAMTHTTIPIPLTGVAEPEAGEMVSKWAGRDPHEVLSDPVEQKRFSRILTDEEFSKLSWYTSFRSDVLLQGDFVFADGCVKYMCEVQNAVFAIRISDGAPFARIYDHGDVIERMPEGEVAPW